MECLLIDVYRSNEQIVLWIKIGNKNVRLTRTYRHHIYAQDSDDSRALLEKLKIPYTTLQKRTYFQTWKRVNRIAVPSIMSFEKFVRALERSSKHRITLYNADIIPEQMFLYEHRIKPCTRISIDKNKYVTLDENCTIPFSVATLEIFPAGDFRTNPPVHKIVFNEKSYEGEEKEVLTKFIAQFNEADPDVLFAGSGFALLPYILQRMEKHNLSFSFHRWDHTPLAYRGGKTFYTYGVVRYQDYAIRLHGRLLVDTNTFIGCDCQTDALIELCQLSGSCFQKVASRSYGAVFQAALVRTMVLDDVLVPHKEKPLDTPLTMEELVKADRVGHTCDPRVGFHKNVVEFDFCSMYPWLMYNHNISAETILHRTGLSEQAPGIPVQISVERLGYVPQAIKPFIDRRMFYKEHPNPVHKQRAVGLKWVLVSSYGYLRFREFKLGIPTSHMLLARLPEKRCFLQLNLLRKEALE